MKRILLVSILVLLSISTVGAITQQEISEAKSLIDSNADCKSLTGSQLEIIGEYYMEQMHPGEAHKAMHKMMGLEEGSEAEEQFHVSMAKSIYCGEGKMMGFGSTGMMGDGMMGGSMYGGNRQSNMMGTSGMMAGAAGSGMMGAGLLGGMTGFGNMMGNAFFALNGLNLLLYLLAIVALVLAIILLCKKIQQADKAQ